jgi:hypothetical protein
MFVGMMRRLIRPVAAPFTEQQAALVMSNRQATWDAAYDRERMSRQQQAAIDGMGVVRQQLIGYHQLEPAAGAAAAVDTSAGDGDQSISDYGSSSSSSSDDDQPARRAAAQQGSAELPRLMQQWLSTAPVGQQDGSSVAEMHVSQPAAAEVAHHVAQVPAAAAAATAGCQAAQAPPAAAAAAHQVVPAAVAATTAAAPAAGCQAAQAPAAAAASDAHQVAPAAAAAPAAPAMLPAYPGAILISNNRDRMLQHSANLLSAVGRALERIEQRQAMRAARLRRQQQQQGATREMAAGRVATTGGRFISYGPL